MKIRERVAAGPRAATRLVVGVVVLLEPTLYGLVTASDRQVSTSYDLLGVMYRGFTPALFPLYIALLYPLVFADQVAARHVAYIRNRTAFSRYLIENLRRGALNVGILFFLQALLAVAVSEAATRWNLVGERLVNDLSVSGAATFTQIAEISPALYFFFYPVWVAINGALATTVTMLVLLLIPNRLLALLLPFCVYWAENFVLSTLRLEQFRTVTAIFPFALRQQPIWTALLLPSVWGVTAGALLVVVIRRQHSLQTLR